jgi:hypothetical protein
MESRSRAAGWLERVQQELACIDCGYSLQGLRGDRVVCPECGLGIDLAALVTKRWTGPWYRAPGFNTLLWPVAWLLTSGAALLLLSSWERNQAVASTHWTIIATTGIALIWLIMMIRLRWSPMGWEAVGLAALGHAVLAGYLAGVIGLIGSSCLCMTVAFAAGAGGIVGFLPTLSAFIALPPSAIILLLASRWCGRFIARRCIRFHYRKAVTALPDADGMATPQEKPS